MTDQTTDRDTAIATPTVSEIVNRLATDENDRRAFMQVSLLNVFVAANREIGGRDTMTIAGFRALGRAMKELESVCAPSDNGDIYKPRNVTRVPQAEYKR